MSDNATKVYGGSLLDGIIKLFFNSLNNALTNVAEYEEEMGVLKQVNHIPIEKNGQEYDLKIKLAPIRGKDSYFYVEADTDAPDFDVSGVHDKAMKINNTTLKKFRKIVSKLIATNGYTSEEFDDFMQKEPTQSNEEDQSKENADQSKDQINQSEENSELNKLINDLMKAYNDDPSKILVGQVYDENNQLKSSGELILITISFDTNSADSNNTKVILEGRDLNDKVHDKKKYPIDMYTEDRLKSMDELKVEINKDIHSYAEDYNAESTLRINASTIIKASFIKNKQGEVSLTAIQASTDIKSAMDIIYNIVEDDDFIDNLGEEEKSFEIAEVDDSYDLTEVDEVDTSETYKELFKACDRVHRALRAYKWSMCPQWEGSPSSNEVFWNISSALDMFAELVIRHNDGTQYPYAASLLPDETEFTALDEIKDESTQKLSQERMTEVIKNEVQKLLDIMEFYYINLEPEEQSKVDTVVDGLKHDLTYM